MTIPTGIYPMYGVEKLRTQLGQSWTDLVDHVSQLPVTDPHVMALSLTLRRIQHNLPRKDKQEKQFPRDPLCAMCATEITHNFLGSERELLEMFYRHLDEVQITIRTMRKHRRPHPITQPAAA